MCVCVCSRRSSFECLKWLTSRTSWRAISLITLSDLPSSASLSSSSSLAAAAAAAWAHANEIKAPPKHNTFAHFTSSQARNQIKPFAQSNCFHFPFQQTFVRTMKPNTSKLSHLQPWSLVLDYEKRALKMMQLVRLFLFLSFFHSFFRSLAHSFTFSSASEFTLNTKFALACWRQIQIALAHNKSPGQNTLFIWR